jgi:GTP cyclohydrolase II
MKQVKEELEVQVASLEAELKNVRLAQTKSVIQLDDSRLARIKQSIQDIRTRIKVENKTIDMASQFSDDLGVQVEKKMKTAEVIKEIDNYFGSGASTATAKEAK